MRYFDIFGRRKFFGMITGLAVSIGLMKLPFEAKQRPAMAVQKPEFVVINGWVLTGEDIAASKMTRNAA
jgi:hypothetical protein